ncbi:hypothetical protein ACOTHJ_15985 [Achromobacter xylosoxidans]
MTQISFSPLSAEERKAVRQNWANLHAQSTASDYIMRSFLLGSPLAKHFSPITNGTKLANGARPYAGALKAAQLLRRRFNGQSYRQLLGLSQIQLENDPVHADRIKAMEAWSRGVTDTHLPENL